MAKHPVKTSEASSQIAERTAELLSAADCVGVISKAVITHHHKIPQTNVPESQSIRNMESVTRSMPNSIGLCSPTLESRSPFTATFAGPQIAVGQDLCVPPEGGIGGSLIDLARSGQDHELHKRGLTEEMITHLRSAIAPNEDHYPSSVSRTQKQVFFEAPEDCVLVTPVYPAKLAHELNRRLRERRQAQKEAQDKSDPNGPKLPPHGAYAVGGANPQNVGAIVNKNSALTRRGGIPILFVSPPREDLAPVQKMLRRLRASGRYAAIAHLDDDALLTFGHRAARGIALAVHRHAEASQAADLVHDFMKPRALLTPVLSAFERSFWEQPGWNRIDPDERAWLDPRQGSVDAIRLSTRWAGAIVSRIAKVMDRHAKIKDRTDGDAPTSFLMPDRSFSALEDAFCRALEKEFAG
jgi:hypothetical protein